MALRGLSVALLMAFLVQGSLAATCAGPSEPAKFQMQCMSWNKITCDCPTNYECTLGSRSNKYCQLATCPTWTTVGSCSTNPTCQCPSGYVCSADYNGDDRCVPACATNTKMAVHACYDDGEGSQTCACPSGSSCATWYYEASPFTGSYCATAFLGTPGDQCLKNGKSTGVCVPFMTCTQGSSANKYCEGIVDDD